MLDINPFESAKKKLDIAAKVVDLNPNTLEFLKKVVLIKLVILKL